MQEFLTPAMVADRYGVHIRTVLRWIAAQKLTAIKISNQYRIRPADLAEFERETAQK